MSNFTVLTEASGLLNSPRRIAPLGKSGTTRVQCFQNSGGDMIPCVDVEQSVRGDNIVTEVFCEGVLVYTMTTNAKSGVKLTVFEDRSEKSKYTGSVKNITSKGVSLPLKEGF